MPIGPARMPLMEHLGELRMRLVRISWIQLLDKVQKDIPLEVSRRRTISPGETMISHATAVRLPSLPPVSRPRLIL